LLIDIFKVLWIPDCIEAKFDLESRQTNSIPWMCHAGRDPASSLF